VRPGTTAIHRWILLVGILLVGATISSAHADGDPLAKPAHREARTHLALGNKLYTLREFEKAIAEYKAGALIEDAPVFQYNLAQAYRLSGRYQEALWHYDRFVQRTHPGDPLKSAIEQFTAQMKAELEELATKQQPTDPAGGTPAPNRVAPPPSAKLQHPPHRSNAGWIATGAGSLALAGTALGISFWGDRTYARAKASMVQSERESLAHSADTRRYIAEGLGVAAIGCAGVAVYLYISKRAERGGEATALTPVISSGHAGVAVTGSW
jgi:tetratricopeptide (TPR) repeat protein